MFTLATLEDSIRLDPSTFTLDHNVALTQEINRKFSNKVLPEVGLCISLYDIVSSKDGVLRGGDGAVYVETRFRLVVFAPFVGEILVGWISSCTPEGINVRMEFFDDVFLPSHMLFEGSQFISKEQAWVWNVNDMNLYLDTNEKLRFRVEKMEFLKKGMRIIGSCGVEGLGLISWWT